MGPIIRKKQQRIRIDRIPAYGITGLILAIGIIVNAMIGVPETRPFLTVAVPAGILVGALRYLWIKQTR